MMSNCTELCNKWRPPPLEELCYILQPPPLNPESFTADTYNALLTFAESDTEYITYHKWCNLTMPIRKTSPSTVTVTTSSPTSTLSSTSKLLSASELSSTLTSSVNQTGGLVPSDTDNKSSVGTRTTSTTTSVPFTDTNEVAKAGTSLAAVLVPIFIVVTLLIAGFLVFYCKKKKGRQASVALPLKTYQDTNYLDNKAKLSLCWKGAEVKPPHDTTMRVSVTQNVYGPITHGRGNGVYSKHTDKKSNKKEKESLKFDKLNISQNSSNQQSSGFENETFETESDLNGTGSPGASSQTPLFDDVDGVLPNSPIANDISSKDNPEKRDSVSGNPENRGSGSGYLSPEKTGSGNFSPVKAGSENILPRGRLPPVEMRKEKLNSSSASIGSKSSSPKKCKKPVYLRKSEPLGDINKDIGDNRKSC